MALAREGTEKQKEHAAAALGDLTLDNADNKAAIREAGGVPPLVALARAGTRTQKERAEFALRFLANGNEENKAAIRAAGDPEALREFTRGDEVSTPPAGPSSPSNWPPPLQG